MKKERERSFLREVRGTLEKSGLIPAILGLIKELTRILFKPSAWQEKRKIVE